MRYQPAALAAMLFVSGAAVMGGPAASVAVAAKKAASATTKLKIEAMT
jgi:hypothetical protein